MKKFLLDYENQVPYESLARFKKTYASWSFFNSIISFYTLGVCSFYFLTRKRVWSLLTSNWKKYWLIHGIAFLTFTIKNDSRITQESLNIFEENQNLQQIVDQPLFKENFFKTVFSQGKKNS